MAMLAPRARKNAGLERVGGHRHAPGCFIHSTHCRGGWVGPRACLERKFSPSPVFEHWAVQHVAFRCTNYAIPAVSLIGNH